MDTLTKILMAAGAVTVAAGLVADPTGPLTTAVGSFASGAVMAALLWDLRP